MSMATKLLSNREMELLRRLIYQSHTGGDIETTATKVAKSLSFKIDPDDLAECIEVVQGQSSGIGGQSRRYTK